MGATLDDTLAELAALQATQQGQGPPPPPPQGSPQRPPFLATQASGKKAGGVSPQQRSPANKPASAQGGGVLSQAKDALSNFGKFVQEGNPLTAQGRKTLADRNVGGMVGVVRAPVVLAGGIADTFADQGKLNGDSIKAAFVRDRKPATLLGAGAALATQATPLGAAFTAASQARRLTKGASLKDVLSARETAGKVGSPQVNQATAELTANVAALALPGGTAPKALPYVARLAWNSGVQGVIAGAVADTGTENPMLDRAKVAATGAALNVVAEPLLGLLGSAISKRAGATSIVEATPKEALDDNLDRAFATGRTQEERYLQTERSVQANSDPASAGAAGDLPVSDGVAASAANAGRGDTLGSEGGSPKPVDGDVSGGMSAGGRPSTEVAPERATDLAPEVDPYMDAQSALRLANIDEALTPETHPLRGDGRIPLNPANKKLADEAGIGRAFYAADDGLEQADTVIFKETDPEGGSRVVSSWDRADLESFQNDAEMYLYGDKDGGLVGTDPSARHAAGQWKLGNLAASYDSPAYLRALADRLPKRAVTSDADLMAAAKAQADAIGWDVDDMLAYSSSIAQSVEDIVPTAATIRTVLARAGSIMEANWDAIGGRLDDLADDSTELLELQRHMHAVMAITQDVAEFKSGLGGALRTQGLPDADTFMANFGKVPEGHLSPVDPLDGLPKLPRTKAELKQWMDAWNYTKDNPEARQAFLEGLTFMRGKWWYVRNSFANFFTSAIISAPSTVLRNFIGPATMSGLRTLERSGGAWAASLNPMISQESRRELLAVAQTSWRAYVETFGDLQTAFHTASKALKDGHGVLDNADLYNLRTERIPQSLMDMAVAADGPGLTGDLAYKVANGANIFPRWIHALHGSTNEFAQRLAYLGEVRASAYLEASQKGLKGADVDAYVRTRLKNSTDEVTFAGLDEDAIAQSRRTNFIQQVGSPGSTTEKWARVINQTRTNIPETRYILPIFSVPANAAGEVLRRLPVVGGFFRETAEELSGSMGAIRQGEAYGRMMSGAAFLGMGFLMARNGMLTGPGPSDPEDRKVWLAQGFQPYSVKLGDRWVSYNKLDVVGPMLAVPAMVYDKSVHTQGDKQNMAWVGAAALAQYFKDQAALQGLSDLLSFGDDPAQSQGLAMRFLNQTTRGFVPNFIQQIGRNNVDGTARVVRDPVDALLNALPGTSLMLDPQRNTLGEPTNRIENVGFNIFPLTITQANNADRDYVVDEMSRLYERTGYAPGIKGTALPGGNIDMRDIKLEGGRSLYDALTGARAQVTDDDGRTLRDALTELFDSEEYNEAVDADATNLETDTGELSRGALMSRVFSEFDRLASQKVAQESPIAARYLAVGALKRTNDAVLRDTPTRDIARNPDLLKALGININDYEEKVKGQ